MSEPTIIPVILCGGSGTRLWPRSRKARPKPFLPLTGERTLFQATLDRCRGEGFASPIIVAGKDHMALVADQSSPDATLIVEPSAKSTAPAIGLAAASLPADAIMLVCPSDHHIADAEAFREAARAAAGLAADGWLVAFGINAKRPETGYGYIRRGEAIAGGYRIDRFVEKPDRATAETFLAKGGYAWNGGIFAFLAGAYLDELAAHRPAMVEAVRAAINGAERDGSTIHPAAGPFAGIAAESVDYAVMENSNRAAVVPADMGWSDIGNWAALRDALAGDADGNRTRGKADLVDCRNVLVDTDGPRVSVVGLQDVIVVVDGDEVLVTSAEGTQLVGKLPGPTNQ
ncbi:Alginate biosynthesis protein AlgA [Tsuneonella dongtanensis]|uniref:Alginate biosynthesis protein AlgA n=1 Tax=Tsuneonella dongtanensis TaxID=692370 RepID=A0A1B2A8V2_9SPHN|nr:sugar phosphate nucleotidyltransferase [Tsuneonella dongtanensis]ANY18597.1 Alginate biosynthesis protein AlgA [Tsuneonella dongtanensis]